MTKDTDDIIGCRDSCGAKVLPADAEKEGWQFLEASRLWRCPACHAALQKINEGEAL